MLSEGQRRGIVLAAALVGAVLTARLGVWQLDRGQQKVALQQAIESRAQLPPLDGRALAVDAASAALQHHRRVTLQGTWLADRTVYLDNRQMHDPGFYVLTPLLLAPGDAVIVQRGWLPRNAADRTQVAPVDTPTGEVTVQGRIAPPPSRLYDFAGAASGPIRQNLDLAAHEREIGVRLRPLSVLQLDAAPAPAVSDGLLRDWPLPAVGVQRHWGYAAQWFGFSALITGLYVWFQLIRPRRRAR